MDNDQSNDIMDTYHAILALEKTIENHLETIELIQYAIIEEVNLNPENEETIFGIFNPRIEFFQEKIQTKVI